MHKHCSTHLDLHICSSTIRQYFLLLKSENLDQIVTHPTVLFCGATVAHILCRSLRRQPALSKSCAILGEERLASVYIQLCNPTSGQLHRNCVQYTGRRKGASEPAPRLLSTFFCFFLSFPCHGDPCRARVFAVQATGTYLLASGSLVSVTLCVPWFFFFHPLSPVIL